MRKIELSEKEYFLIRRLIYEIDGNNVLIRSFSISDSEFELDENKYREILNRQTESRNILFSVIENLAKEYNEIFTGKYSIDHNKRILILEE